MLEAVEQEARAAWVDVPGGDTLEDLANGGLGGGAVFGQRELEGGTAVAAPAWVGDGLAGGVMGSNRILPGGATGWRSGTGG